MMPLCWILGLLATANVHIFRSSTVTKEFTQVEWDEATIANCRTLIGLAIKEDLAEQSDITTRAVIAATARGTAHLASREYGIACGLRAAECVIEAMNADVDVTLRVDDGDKIEPGKQLAALDGSAQDILKVERIILNVCGRLSGIATMANRFVQRVAGTKARIYDTRKTTPGWRRLEKYAVQCGGGNNHRLGLFDAILIKDNHIALADSDDQVSLDNVVDRARSFLENTNGIDAEGTMVEIEVDTIEQLVTVFPQRPDIVLLDNMTLDQLRDAIGLRDELSPTTQLEASGGINERTILDVAQTGVDRISVGALTHSARCLDIGLDWQL